MIPLADSIPSRCFPKVTYGLIAANALVFLLEFRLDPDTLQALIYALGVVPDRAALPVGLQGPQVPGWSLATLVTSQFLHGGVLHLLGNMWTLWIFGDNVEDRLGPWRYLLFYLCCGAIAGFVHATITHGSVVPTVGASGAISGIMGAYFVLFPTSRLVMLVPILFIPLFFVVPAQVFLLLWLGLQLWSGASESLGGQQVSNIAFWAHVGGFAAGILLLLLFLPGTGRRCLQPDEFGRESAWLPKGRRSSRYR
ncbi:MAG: rhomboid family intramembrane serine protease [Planctomycetota bacterium]